LGQIYTVSGLTREIKALIEERYPFVWITGEISNLSVPASGHAYFSLKDRDAVISGVMFRNQLKRLKFNLAHGIKITGMGRLSLYEPRGGYQIIFEHIEPGGAGALQLAFEQLKARLAKEGLFDESRKKKIPPLPRRITLITSPTGAAVRDIIQVASRRFPGIQLEVMPVQVQGETAPSSICRALELVNVRHTTDLIILARGGGSLEDLAAFNTEEVARSVFNSEIPIISAIGHETDFTITDFTADLRAPTPSAAAELACPEKSQLIKKILQLEAALTGSFTRYLDGLETRLREISSRLRGPEAYIGDMRFRMDDLQSRLTGQMTKQIHDTAMIHARLQERLMASPPSKDCPDLEKNVQNLETRLRTAMAGILTICRARTREMEAGLTALDPRAVLERGYTIARKLPGREILTHSRQTRKHDMIELTLAEGRINCQVEDTHG